MTLNEVWEVSDNVVDSSRNDLDVFTFNVTTPTSHVWFHFFTHLGMFFVFVTLNEVWEVSDNVVTAVEMVWNFLRLE